MVICKCPVASTVWPDVSWDLLLLRVVVGQVFTRGDSISVHQRGAFKPRYIYVLASRPSLSSPESGLPDAEELMKSQHYVLARLVVRRKLNLRFRQPHE